MKKHPIMILSMIILFLAFTCNVHATSTTDALHEDAVMNAIEQSAGENYNPPFAKKNALGESISTSTGDLSLTVTDFVLKGKNGHDLVIKREYSSQRENKIMYEWDETYEYTFYRPAYLYHDENGVGYYILFYSDAQMIEEAPDTLYTDTLSESHDGYYQDESGDEYFKYEEISAGSILLTRDKVAPSVELRFKIGTNVERDSRFSAYNIGHNWRLVLPYLDDIHGYYDAYGIRFQIGEFNNGEGGIYTFKEALDLPNDYFAWYLKIQDSNQYACNYISEWNTTDETGISYNRTIKDKNGKMMYFNNDGKIVAIDDRFDNRIEFQYDENGLSKIIDTYGREISVETLSGYISKISVGDREIDYDLDYRSDDYKHILTVNDAEGNDTIYESLKKEPLYDSYTSGYDRKTETYNITDITYTTLAQTQYEYNKYTVALNSADISRQKYKIKTRKDVTDEGELNKHVYSYSNTYEGYDPDDNSMSNYTGTIVRSFDGYSQVDTYNKYGKKLNETYTGSDGSKTEKVYTYEDITNDIDANHPSCPPKTITIKQYDRDDNTKVIEKKKEYEYDSKLNIEEEKIEDYIINYTYDSNYSILLTKSFKRDDTHETYVVNTLYNNVNNPDDPLNGRCIEWEEIYEKIYQDGVLQETNLKSKKKFDYDQYGNVTAVHTWDDEENEIIKYSTYTYNADKTYKLEASVDNVADADGQDLGTVSQDYNYDIYGNLELYNDGRGNPTLYTYDKLNRIESITYEDGSIKTNEYYDSENYIISYITTTGNEVKNKRKIEYDDLGNLKASYAFNPDTQKWIQLTDFTYDEVGRKETETLYRKYADDGSVEEKFTITYDYYKDGKIKSQTTTDIEDTTIKRIDYTYEVVDDTINGVTDQYKRITTQVMGDETITPSPIKQYFDKMDRLVKEEVIHNDDGTEKTFKNTYKYDYIGNKIEAKNARAYDENWTEDYTGQYEYDYGGRVTKETNTLGQFIETTYDKLGRIKTKSDYFHRDTSYAYDKLDRLIKVEAPFDEGYNTLTKYYYDGNGNKTKENQQSNKPGEAETYNETDYGYNDRNWLVKVVKHETDTIENYTQYHYDEVGNKTKMFTGLSSEIDTTTETGSDTDFAVTRYEYNYLNQMEKMTDPLLKEVQNEYDLTGNLIQQTDRMNGTITYDYNGLGKLLNKKVDRDGETQEISYTYDILGNRRTMTDENGLSQYSYDDLSRLVTETNPEGITKEYTYDAANNRKTFILKQNDVEKQNLSYTYDNLNRLHELKEDGSIVATHLYDDNGNRESITYTNGNATEYQYNYVNQITTLTNKNGTSLVSEYDYTYYFDGNQESKTDELGTTNYTYDGLGRLETTLESGVTTTYSYDDYNNRETMTITGEPTTSYGYDKNNRLLTETKVIGDITEVTRYGYDNNGNQLWKAKETIEPSNGQGASFKTYVAEESNEKDIEIYEYDGFNQLKKSIIGDKTITYSYNGDGLRTTKSSDDATTTHIWDGSNIVMELDSTGNVLANYIRGINLIASDIEGTRSYYLYNAHGDVVQLTKTDGSIIKTYAYDAFGNEKDIDVEDSNPFRYSGEYFDKETGTIYLRARYYDPSTGRFISEDSYRGRISDPLSLNLYTYCKNNPIAYIDPSGHDPNPMKPYKEVVALIIYATNSIAERSVQVSNAINTYGDKIIEYGSEVVSTVKEEIGEGIEHIKDKISESPNEGVDLDEYGKGTGEAGQKIINGFDNLTVHAGKQGKHIVGHNNYIEGRSIINGTEDDIQKLIDDFAGTGQWKTANKEMVDFGKNIGKYVDINTGEVIDTTRGIIHYSKKGVHIVPAKPIP